MSDNGKKFNTQRADELVKAAAMLALARNNEYVTVDHLTVVCMEDDYLREKLGLLKVNIDNFAREFRDFFEATYPQAVAPKKQRVTETFNKVIHRCMSNMVFSGRRDVTAADLILAIMQETDCYSAYYLNQNGLDTNELKAALAEDAEDDVSDDPNAPEGEGGSGGGRMDKMSPEKAKKILAKFCVNLNEEAFKGKIDPLIGRETEVYGVVKTVSRRTKNNIILTGEPGVGKTAIVEGLAKLIVDGNVPESIQGSTIYSLDVPGLIAGAKFRGDMEERAKQVIVALTKVEKPILFIDEIHMIMGAGAAGKSESMDLSNMLKPALARGELRCIGSTTMDEYRKHFEKDKALMRRFQKQDVGEPTIEDAKRILQGAKGVYEQFHGLTYTDEAIDLAVELTARYVTDRFLPDKAFDVIDAAGATQRIANPDVRVAVITGTLVEDEVSLMAKIPARTVKESDSDKLAHLETDLREVVYGQDDAIVTVADAVILSRAGLREANKPAGAYLFKGPTGVGKTEVAKQLAKTLGIPLLRYDMSEYMEKHSVSKLIGAPPGYVGYGDGQAGAGKLVTDIETNPHCVLLLDELEKAHGDVYNILLQVMDNGRLSSQSGKVVSFENVILIMTSNVGARFNSKAAIGFGSSDRNESDTKILKDTFAPEFLNRLDAIVDFNKLRRDDIRKVVDKFLGVLSGLAADKKVTIDVTDDAKEWLGEKGYDKEMGARPLGRVINDNLKKPLSKAMLFGELKNGGHVTVGVVDDKLKLVYGPIQEIAVPEVAEEAAEA
ncbi:ATP-dependent Clp protease ATP-binding subunit ClpA [compost metagenome]